MADAFKVIIPDTDIRFNASLDYWMGQADCHAEGYRQAAEVLLQHFLDDPTPEKGSVLVLPILFLFRHYIELRCKDIIVYGQALLGQQAAWPIGHDLRKWWEQAKKLYRESLGTNLNGQSEKTHTCILEISALDPDSTSFRYPYDKNGQPIFNTFAKMRELERASVVELS